jgi:hypothetical protein
MVGNLVPILWLTKDRFWKLGNRYNKLTTNEKSYKKVSDINEKSYKKVSGMLGSMVLITIKTKLAFIN